MKVKEVIIEGVPLVFPSASIVPKRLRDFPNCCGPGWASLLIPDKPYTLRFSPACKAHDDMFAASEPTLDNFIMAAATFEQNLYSLLKHTEQTTFEYAFNKLFIDLFVNSVSGPIGLIFFCKKFNINNLYRKLYRQLISNK